MPNLPWTATGDLDPRREYLALATRFVVRHRCHVPAVVRSAQTLWSEFASTDGLLGYSLRASLSRGTLSTLTVWRDRDAMTTFVRGEPHVTVVHQTSRWLADARFASWTALGLDLPPTWHTATEQLLLLVDGVGARVLVHGVREAPGAVADATEAARLLAAAAGAGGAA